MTSPRAVRSASGLRAAGAFKRLAPGCAGHGAQEQEVPGGRCLGGHALTRALPVPDRRSRVERFRLSGAGPTTVGVAVSVMR